MTTLGRRSRQRGMGFGALWCGVWFAACGGRTLDADEQNRVASDGGGAASGPARADAPSVRAGSSTMAAAGRLGLGGFGAGVSGSSSGGASFGVAGYAEGGYAEGGSAENAAGAPAAGTVGEAGAAGTVGEAGAAGAAGCELNGESHPVGEHFTEGCSVCTCRAGGVLDCDGGLCALMCARYAASFAAVINHARGCDPLDPLACQGTMPTSLRCGCPVPSNSVVYASSAWRFRATWLNASCGQPDPQCDVCDTWDAAFCTDEGVCSY